jgi:hypothetical protein
MQDALTALQNPRVAMAWYKAAIRCHVFDRVELRDRNDPDEAQAA